MLYNEKSNYLKEVYTLEDRLITLAREKFIKEYGLLTITHIIPISHNRVKIYWECSDGAFVTTVVVNKNNTCEIVGMQ